MLHKIVGILVIMFLTYLLSGQTQTFEYLLSTPENEFVRDIYESENGDIFFTGFISKYPNQKIKTKSLTVKIDESGYFIDSLIINFPEMRFKTISFVTNGNNEYILTGSKTDTTGQLQNISIVLLKININLDILETAEFKFPPDYKATSHFSMKGSDDSFFVSGTVDTINPFRMYIYKFNYELDSIKAKFFLDNTIASDRLKEFDDGKIWVLAGVQESYFILDSAWAIISETDIPGSINDNFGLKWDTDTSFYLVGEWHPSPPIEDNNDVGIIRQFDPIDTTMHFFQSWGTVDMVDFPGLWGALDFKNKDSIFIGGTTNMWGTYYGTWPSWYFVIQTDSMLNIRWERFYGGDAYYLMQKIIATNDGGCLIAGTRFDYQNATEEELDIHILKLNEEGLIVGGQNEILTEIREAIVFPNPGSENIKIRIAVQYPESTFELYDINSKLLVSKNIRGKWGNINTTFLRPGTYVFRIFNDDGLFESGKWIKR